MSVPFCAFDGCKAMVRDEPYCRPHWLALDPEHQGRVLQAYKKAWRTGRRIDLKAYRDELLAANKHIKAVQLS